MLPLHRFMVLISYRHRSRSPFELPLAMEVLFLARHKAAGERVQGNCPGIAVTEGARGVRWKGWALGWVRGSSTPCLRGGGGGSRSAGLLHDVACSSCIKSAFLVSARR